MRKTIQNTLLGLLMASSGALATPIITITFNNSPQSGPIGSMLTFMATMMNTSGQTEDLNGDGFTLPAPFTLANVDDSAFFNSWPMSLTANQSFGPAALFKITIPNSAAPGPYTGTFNLLGGPGPTDQNLIGTANFQVQVTGAVPEPGSGVLALLGLGGLAVTRRLRRKRR